MFHYQLADDLALRQLEKTTLPGFKLLQHSVLKLRMYGAMPSLSLYTSMIWCLIKCKDNFTFTVTGAGGP